MTIERVKLRRDTHFVGGDLKAQAGATGVVVGDDRGMLTIHFDDTEHFVALDGSGLRIAHNVPRLAVEAETFALMGRRFRVLTTFPDTDAGTDDANEYMQSHPGASVLAVANGRVVLADKNDKGVPVPARDL